MMKRKEEAQKRKAEEEAAIKRKEAEKAFRAWYALRMILFQIEFTSFAEWKAGESVADACSTSMTFQQRDYFCVFIVTLSDTLTIS